MSKKSNMNNFMTISQDPGRKLLIFIVQSYFAERFIQVKNRETSV